MTHNDSQVEALARCPFCGGAGDYNTVQGWHGIGCLTRNCPGYRHALHHRTKEAAIAAWNGRTALSALTAGKVEAKPTREQMMAGYAVACRYKVYEAQAFNLAEAMWRAMLAASPSPLSADPESAVVGAASHQISSPEIPEGWTLVPVKPTHEMAEAGTHARWKHCLRDPDSSREIWASMLATAPTLPHPALDRANAGERESYRDVMQKSPNELPTTEELEALYETTHYGHPADFAADVLERWGGWMPGLLGHGGALQKAVKLQAGERESEARGARCGSYECKASQQDGVLCADGDCDIASGVRAAALPAADPERREGAEGVKPKGGA
jgi:hypothetical protein